MLSNGGSVPDASKRASNLQTNVQVAVQDRKCLLLNVWSVAMSTALPLRMAEVAAQAAVDRSLSDSWLTAKYYHAITLRIIT